MRAEAQGLILFSGLLGVFYLLAGGLPWHGAKSCLGPAEISPNVFGVGGHRMSSGFHLLAADPNKGNRDVGWTQGQGWEQV